MIIKTSVAAAALFVGAQFSNFEVQPEKQKLSSAEIAAYLEANRSVPDHCVVVQNNGAFCVYSGPGCPLFAPCP